MELLKIVEAFTKGLTMVQEAVKVLQAAKDELPEGDRKTAAAKKLDEVEHTLRLAKAEMGGSLGYHLCHCTWPPQVMLSSGYEENTHLERWQCPNCKKVISVHQAAKPKEEGKAFDPYDVY